MAKKHSFSTKLRPDGTFVVPLDVKAIFGTARAPVKMTLRGETFRARVAAYGGTYVLGVWKAVREKHGLTAGTKLAVTLEPDTVPRVIAPPAALAAALKRDTTARAGWDAMSYTHKREWARAIDEAKKPETRARRVEQALAALRDKARTSKTRAKATRTSR